MPKNVLGSSRNIIVQAYEDGANIRDKVNPMEGNDVGNIIENDGIKIDPGHLCYIG